MEISFRNQLLEPKFVNEYCTISKRKDDRKDYRMIQLANGIKILLISDYAKENEPTYDFARRSTGTPETDLRKASEVSLSNSHQSSYYSYNSSKTNIEKTNKTKSEKTKLRSELKQSLAAENIVESSSDESTPSSEMSSGSSDSSMDWLSAAALCINVGSFNDPPHSPGMAHFTEHMLFMGSQKYPKENALDLFLHYYSGLSNAYTESEFTSFYFEISNHKFINALDMFCHMFVNPLFRLSAIDRELEALNSEFEKAREVDENRREQILAHFANSKHPQSQFSWDNNFRESSFPSVWQFDRTKFENEIEKMVQRTLFLTSLNDVQSNKKLETLDEMQEYISKIFIKIPRKENEILDVKALPRPFANNNFTKIFHVVPVNDVTELVITWALPPLHVFWRIKPLEFLASIIGNEGYNGLFHYLAKKYWITDLNCGRENVGFDNNSSVTLFRITMMLTEKGVAKVYNILSIVFQYLELLRIYGPLKRQYDDLQSIQSYLHEYRAQTYSLDLVDQLSKSMHLYPVSNIIDGEPLMFTFHADVIRDILNALTPFNCNIMVSSQFFETLCHMKESRFRTFFNKGEIPLHWLDSWKVLKINPDLKLPGKNRYICEDFNSVEPEFEFQTNSPVVIKYDDKSTLWYYNNNEYENPKVVYYLQIQSPLPSESALNATMCDLYTIALQEALRCDLYLASVAGLYFEIYGLETGLVYHFYGFSDKLPLLFRTVLDRLDDLRIDSEYFLTLKRILMMQYVGYITNPSEYNTDSRLSILHPNGWSWTDRYRAVDIITLPMLTEFVCRLNSFLRLVTFFAGNIKIKLALELHNEFVKKINFCTLPDLFFPRTAIGLLGEKDYYVKIKNLSEVAENSSVCHYYQFGSATHAEYAALEVLVHIMEEPLFNSLRTVQQLGYSTYANVHEIGNIYGVAIQVETQAENHSVAEVSNAITKFLAVFQEKMFAMTNKDFQQHVRSTANMLDIDDSCLADVADFFWQEINHRNFQFNRKKLQINSLKELKLNDMLVIFLKLFSKQRRRLLVSMIAGTGKCEQFGPKLDEAVVTESEGTEEANEPKKKTTKSLVQVPERGANYIQTQRPTASDFHLMQAAGHGRLRSIDLPNTQPTTRRGTKILHHGLTANAEQRTTTDIKSDDSLSKESYVFNFYSNANLNNSNNNNKREIPSLCHGSKGSNPQIKRPKRTRSGNIKLTLTEIIRELVPSEELVYQIVNSYNRNCATTKRLLKRAYVNTAEMQVLFLPMDKKDCVWRLTRPARTFQDIIKTLKLARAYNRPISKLPKIVHYTPCTIENDNVVKKF